MKNKHKGMKLYNIWLTEEEEEGLLYELKRDRTIKWIGALIKEVYKRGDLFK